MRIVTARMACGCWVWKVVDGNGDPLAMDGGHTGLDEIGAGRAARRAAEANVLT